MKRIIVLSSILFLFITYGLVINQYDIRVIPKQIQSLSPEGFYDYQGITHLHSNNSLGSRPANEIIEIAKKTSLDFIIFTDLNNFSKNTIPAGYHQNLLVIEAQKYSYLDSRIVTYSKNQLPSFSTLGEVSVFLTDLLSQNRINQDHFFVLAHPLKTGFLWTGNYPIGLTGIEVLNLNSFWDQILKSSKISVIWSSIVYLFNPRLAFLRLFTETPDRELQLWDQLNRDRTVYGFSGNHATARAIPYAGQFVRFPSYEQSFSFTTNHVVLNTELTGDTKRDQIKILNALQSGQFYFSIDLLGNPKGFNTYIKEEKKIYPMGSRLNLNSKQKFITQLPNQPIVPFEVVIYRNGERYKTFNNSYSEFFLSQSGVYRVIVRVIPTLPLPDGKKWFIWIYSNPFFVE